MNFDFAAFLVLASVLSGGIWALDAWVLAPRRRREARRAAEDKGTEVDPKALREPVIVEYARSFFPIILLVLLLRSFVVEPFRIPSASMMPTLLAGDFILVQKYAYGLRLPVLNYKFVELGEPKRGDVIVFRYPEDPGVDYIKRVVGLPGDHIRYRQKVLYVNGEPMRQYTLGPYVDVVTGLPVANATVRVEQLGEVEHEILHFNHAPGREGEYVVPAGHYFVMGDNRDNSNDSRYWGAVPEENLVGRAFMIWMHWNGSGGILWNRIGKRIQ